MLKTARVFLVIVAMLAAGSAPAEDGPDPKLLQRLQDRIEIEALMWRYVRALDTLDADAYAAVFTEDGEFGSGANAARGRAALAKMVADIRKSRAERESRGEPPSPPMHHVIANSRLEFVDADTARLHAYWMTVFGARGQDVPPRVAAVGRSIDELVRVDGQWLIRSRNVAPQD